MNLIYQLAICIDQFNFGATPIEPADEVALLKNTLGFVIRLNEQGSYIWSGKAYYVVSKAYEKWLNALERKVVNKYFFILFLGILYEERNHAVE